MRSHSFLPAIILFVALIVFGFTNRENSQGPAANIQHDMAKISDNLYACKYEVSNLEYNEFLQSIKTTDPSLYAVCLTDSAKWLTLGIYSTPLVKYYHRHPAYNNYPAVNISYRGALAYCEWLTMRYNNDEKRKFNKVQFFLPSEELWMEVANGGNKDKIYPWANYYLRDKKGQFLCNFKQIGDQFITYDKVKKNYEVSTEAELVSADQGFYTSPVNSFLPSPPYGIHNMSGNVAEIVSEEGVAKGGSYNSPGYDVRIQSKLNYSGASPEVGFRVFMKIISPDSHSSNL